MTNKLAQIGDVISGSALDRAAMDYTLSSIEVHLDLLDSTVVRDACAGSPEDVDLLDDTASLLLAVREILPLVSDCGLRPLYGSTVQSRTSCSQLGGSWSADACSKHV
jgi:hypothetical protein